jgi:cell division septation protein DedD
VKGTCATNNALPVFDAATPAAFALLELGYNDNPAKFGGAIDQAMQALTGKGVTRVVWVNLSERRPDSKAKSYYAPANVALEAATTRWPQLIVLDWNAASIGDEATSWFLPGTATAPDLVHLTSVGRTRFALFLRSRLDDLRAQGLLPKDAPPPDTTNPTTSTTTSTAPAGSTTTSSPPPPSTNATTTTTTTVKPAARPTLKPGASGKNVMDLQNALIGRGYSLSADGQFGRKTTLAVKAFQRSKRLRADGIVGAKTWKALGL